MGIATTQTIWGIHAGRTGDAHTLFLQKGVIAIGWEAMGDLSAIPAKRDAFKTAYSKAYPNDKPAAIPNNAGQPFRFVHEMKEGDLVVYPSKQDRKINIGQITGLLLLVGRLGLVAQGVPSWEDGHWGVRLRHEHVRQLRCVRPDRRPGAGGSGADYRSEERRVGQERRSRRSTYCLKKKKSD